MKKLQIVPIKLSEANLFVQRHHRHHGKAAGHICSLAVAIEDDICGVAIVGRPVARKLDDGLTVEVTRLCTDGAENACSLLYGAARRVAKDKGYRRGITYTLPEEGGASLRASGWFYLGVTPGKSWSVKSRPREDKHPLGVKHRWGWGEWKESANGDCAAAAGR